jgi:hypothetical protein
VAGVPSSRSKTDKSGVVLRRQQKVDPKLCESTDGQSVEAQARQLTEAGCKKVFREVASRAKTDRAQLRPDATLRSMPNKQRISGFC